MGAKLSIRQVLYDREWNELSTKDEWESASEAATNITGVNLIPTVPGR